MHESPSALHRFFAGITEQTFQTQLGVADTRLTDYLTDLLTRFIRQDAVYRVRNATGRPIAEINSMLTAAENRVGSARREVHQHIGDFALFWSGIYPESLNNDPTPTVSDHLVDYCEQGKRAYWIASTIEDEQAEVPGEVLERLSHEFEMCAYGLREVRREWERRDGEGPQRPFLIN